MTANKAAAEVRHKIKRKMRDLENQHMVFAEQRWTVLREYIDGMAKRASAKRGGLGRK